MGVRTSLSLGSEGGAVAKELALTALIGLTLTVPMVSLQTVDDVGGLQLHGRWGATVFIVVALVLGRLRSEEHTSELQSLMRISYAVFCLKKKKKPTSTLSRADRTYTKYTCMHIT